MHERRKHQRFTLHDSCIINHAFIVGTITDIGMGGLACMCLDQNKCNSTFPPQVNIYCRKHNLLAEGINIKILGTKSKPGEFIPEFGIRTCRIQFKQLQKEQAAQLEDIIVKYSVPQ